MLPRLVRAKEKLKKYIKKLAKFLYHLAARIFNPKSCTAFLKDKNDDLKLTAAREKQLYIIRKI